MDIKASIFSHILKYFLENINFYIGLWAWLGDLRLSSQCSGSRGMQISGRLGPAGLQRVPGQSKFYGEALSPKKSYMWTVALFFVAFWFAFTINYHYCYIKYILFHATREDDAPHRNHSLSNKNSSTRHEDASFELLVGDSNRAPKQYWLLPLFSAAFQNLKAKYYCWRHFNIGLWGTELKRTWKLPPWALTLIVLQRAMKATKREEQSRVLPDRKA